MDFVFHEIHLTRRAKQGYYAIIRNRDWRLAWVGGSPSGIWWRIITDQLMYLRLDDLSTLQVHVGYHLEDLGGAVKLKLEQVSLVEGLSIDDVGGGVMGGSFA